MQSRKECRKTFFRSVAVLLPVIFVVLLTSLFFVCADQFLDIYRDVAQTLLLGRVDPESEGITGLLAVSREFILTIAAVAALSATIWLISESLLYAPAADTNGLCTAALGVRRILPVALTVLPVLMLALGLNLARVDQSAQARVQSFLATAYFESSVAHGVKPADAKSDADGFAAELMRYDALLFWWSMALIVLAVAAAVYLVWKTPTSERLFLPPPRSKLTWRQTFLYATVTGTAVIAISLLVSWWPLEFGVLLGPLAVFCLFCISLLFAMDVLRRFSELSGYPVLLGLAGLAIIFSLARLNDNHAVRFEASKAPGASELPAASDEFRKWLANRTDLDGFSKGRYPIYIVAAQGGGIYAAFHAATFLGDAQEMCPNFAHHLFAISAVSGGSVGASVFNALLREAEANGKMPSVPLGCDDVTKKDARPPYFDAAIAALNKDFWSPLQAAQLFPDFLQRFLFWPVPAFDRARALEHALETAWSNIPQEAQFPSKPGTVAKETFAGAYATHWNPESLKHVPALLLNTTDVWSGQRRVIAPFHFLGTGPLEFFPLSVTGSDGKTQALPLSTAAVLSSRFPWITPPGWVKRPTQKAMEPQETRVVDGGYFENSGVATALDLLKNVVPQLRLRPEKFEVNLIILTSEDFAFSMFLGFGETFGPIRAMLNTRTARASIEVARAAADLERLSTDQVVLRPIVVRLRGLGYPLPLGWRLAKSTQYLIQYQKGVRGNCNGGEDANCAKDAIYRQLSRL